MAPSIHSPSSSSSSELPPNLCSTRQSRRFSEPTDVMRMMEKAKEEQNKKKKEAPKQKGEWLPAAIFIFLSHILVGLYSIGFIQYHLFTPSLSSPSSAAIDDFSYYRVSGWMVVLTLFSAWLNLLGITAGYHRLWSHNSYKATTSLRIFLAIIGLCSFQGSARWWVLKHRLHHRFTDTDCDPYDARKGLWYSHIGWLFEAPPYISKVHLISMKDVDTDPVAAFQKRHLLIGYVLFGLILPGMIGMWCDGSFIIGAIWIGFIGRFISWHCIWTINSLSHWHGYREFSRASSAVYVMLVNLIQNGEGHHNYHHNFPLDYRHGHRWYEWDPTKWLINVWYYFGLAYDLQTIPDEQITLAQSMVKHEEADELSRQVRNLSIDESKLPSVTEAEFEAMASKSKGAKVILRWGCFVLDVSEFVDSGSHPGGSSYLKAYHGRDMTDAFEGEINLHTQAAHNWAKQMRIARISQ